jgi:hypothetical protein
MEELSEWIQYILTAAFGLLGWLYNRLRERLKGLDTKIADNAAAISAMKEKAIQTETTMREKIDQFQTSIREVREVSDKQDDQVYRAIEKMESTVADLTKTTIESATMIKVLMEADSSD